MPRFLTPLSIILAGVIIAISHLYVNGKLTLNLGRGSGRIAGVNQFASPSPTATPALPPVKEIPVGSSPFLGKADAPIVVIEFSDFQCPFCAAVFGHENEAAQSLKGQDPNWRPILPNLKKEYVETGLVKFVYKDFAFLGDESRTAADAALCARDQGKFWEYHDLLFQNQKGENQGAFREDKLKKLGREVGLDSDTFEKCLDSRSHAAQVEENTNLLRRFAQSNNLTKYGTPAFFINGQFVPGGAIGYDQFKSLIEAARKRE